MPFFFRWLLLLLFVLVSLFFLVLQFLPWKFFSLGSQFMRPFILNLMKEAWSVIGLLFLLHCLHLLLSLNSRCLVRTRNSEFDSEKSWGLEKQRMQRRRATQCGG
ncbi:hypothetical protein V8G54_014868 [Vigna mungo]|uniref:Uncharacterized protein n=1 Tax=Vigna mungo TaxID=3915 RepID=A0AAQ3RYY6_VIGMU